MFMAVDRNNNPKSENYHTWYVVAGEGYGKPLETVFKSESKKECVEYVKAHADAYHIGNGIEYGARW